MYSAPFTVPPSASATPMAAPVPGHPAEEPATVQQRHHLRLVRRCDHHAAQVPGQEAGLEEHRQIAHRHPDRHQHGVDAEALEHGIEHARQAHVDDRVTGDQVDVGTPLDGLHDVSSCSTIVLRASGSLEL
jgi:hypothetical protein